jgi:hypothetical protein
MHFLIKKIHTTKSAQPLGIKRPLKCSWTNTLGDLHWLPPTTIAAIQALPPLALGGASGDPLRCVSAMPTQLWLLSFVGSLGPLHTQDWGPESMALQALSLVKKAKLVQVCFTLLLRDRLNKWIQDGCKVYIDSYMASNGSCFMVTWTIYKNHLLEVGLTQKRETMALLNLTTIDVLHFIMYENPHE